MTREIRPIQDGLRLAGMEHLVVHTHSKDLPEPAKALGGNSGAALCAQQAEGGKKDATTDLEDVP